MQNFDGHTHTHTQGDVKNHNDSVNQCKSVYAV